MRAKTLLWALVLPLCLGGCANTPAMRSLAGNLGSYADAHRARLLDAQARYNDLNGDAARERSQLEAQSAEARQRANRMVRAAKIARPPRIVLIEASSPEDIVNSLKASTATVAPLDAGDAAAKLDAASKVSAQMAVKPKKLAEAKEIIGIYSQIQGELTSLQSAAAKQSQDTSSTAATNAATPAVQKAEDEKAT